MKREIPGYFYDDIKKKYFKITKEFKRPPVKPTLIQPNSYKKLFNELNHRAITSNNFKIISKTCQRKLFNQLCNHNLKYSKVLPDELDETKISCHRISISPSGKVLTMFCRVNGQGHIHMYNIIYRSMDTVLSFKDCFNLGRYKAESIAWSPVNYDKFIVSSSGMLKSHRFVNICNIKSNSYKVLFQSKDIDYHCVGWSCFNQNKIAIGTSSSGIFLHDIDNKSIRGRYSHMLFLRSGIEAVKFSENSSILYAACSSGNIFNIDTRAANNIIKCYDNEQLNVSCIDDFKLLKDENYIVASDLSGKMFLLDHRMRRFLVNYKFHVNNHYPLGFCIDQNENFIYAVGSDSCFRVWNLYSGLLELNFCLDYNKNSGSFLPSITYTSNVGGYEGYGAMFCMYGDKYNAWPFY